jgi:hypothetical protein
MHSALFIAKPSRGSPDWNGFNGALAQPLRHDEDIQRLAENVWLVSFQKSPRTLSWLVVSAERHGIAYGILPFDAEPQWLPVGFDPKTIEGQSVG